MKLPAKREAIDLTRKIDWRVEKWLRLLSGAQFAFAGLVAEYFFLTFFAPAARARPWFVNGSTKTGLDGDFSVETRSDGGDCGGTPNGGPAGGS